MAFDAYGVTSSETKTKNLVDFDELNKYVVETAQLEQPETMIGYISNIIDLGTQKLPDSEYKLDSEDEGLSIEELESKYAQELNEGKISKFDFAYDFDAKGRVIKKFVPQRDRQSIIYSVDFPDIMVDKSPFFGQESDPKPLRLWAGGEWWNKYKRQMEVQNVIPLKKTKDDKLGWTLHPKSNLYKMALASKIITANDAFQPEQIDQLLGKSLQFKVQVYFNKGKDGREYYTEKLSFAAGLARGQQPHEDVTTHLIQFHAENDETALRELRKHVINTMSNATNFGESIVRKQLIDLNRYTPSEEEVTAPNIGVETAKAPSSDDVEEMW